MLHDVFLANVGQVARNLCPESISLPIVVHVVWNQLQSIMRMVGTRLGELRLRTIEDTE